MMKKVQGEVVIVQVCATKGNPEVLLSVFDRLKSSLEAHGLSLCLCEGHKRLNAYISARSCTGLCMCLQAAVLLFAQGQSALCPAATLSTS